jgi:hypothetical protein
VTALGDNIKRWCQVESLSVVIQQDDDVALACDVSVSNDPPLTVSVRSSGHPAARTLLSHTFEPSIPAEVAGADQGNERVTALLERVTTSRSGLVECHLVGPKERPAAEIVATLHDDGMTKQGLLSALEEIRKVRSVITFELEEMGLAASMVSEVQSRLGNIVEEAPDTAEAISPPEAATAAQAQQTAPAPSPTPEAAAPSAPTRRFCPNCGREAKPGQRFCIGCGTSLEEQR